MEVCIFKKKFFFDLIKFYVRYKFFSKSFPVKVNWGKYQLTDELFLVREYKNNNKNEKEKKMIVFVLGKQPIRGKKKLIFEKKITRGNK